MEVSLKLGDEVARVVPLKYLSNAHGWLFPTDSDREAYFFVKFFVVLCMLIMSLEVMKGNFRIRGDE